MINHRNRMQPKKKQFQNPQLVSCDLLNKLQDYMLTEYVIQRSKNYDDETFVVKHMMKNESIKNVPKQNTQSTFFIPRHKDTLFWCFYLMKHGDIEYDMLGQITHIVEKKIKIEYVEKIRNNKQVIKPYKFMSLSNLENMLVNEHRIDLNVFLALCVLENVNVIYINKRTYYELITNDEDDIFILNNVDNVKYGYRLSKKCSSEVEFFRSSLFKIENIQKPVKPVSSYKLQELVDLCNKLELDTVNKDTKKPKQKKELYELIVQYF